MNRIYAYLRASTKEQDENRGRKALEDFAQNVSRSISGWFAENESGATLKRPELFRHPTQKKTLTSPPNTI